MNKLLIITILLFFSSCKDKKNGNNEEKNKVTLEEVKKVKEDINTSQIQNREEIAITGNESLVDFDTLQRKVFYQGDINAYRSLKNEIMIDGFPNHFIFWSMHMAYKYDSAEAYFDLYRCIILTYDEYGVGYDKMDVKTQTMLKQFLQIAANGGIEKAQEILDEMEKSS